MSLIGCPRGTHELSFLAHLLSTANLIEHDLKGSLELEWLETSRNREPRTSFRVLCHGFTCKSLA